MEIYLLSTEQMRLWWTDCELLIKQRNESVSTAPSTVSEIRQPAIIYVQEPTQLRCIIQGARQREIKVKWFRVKSSPDSVVSSESASLLLSEDLSEQACLHSEGRHHTSVLTVCLSVTDDLSEYKCVVLCRGRSFKRETTVRVKGQSLKLQELIIHGTASSLKIIHQSASLNALSSPS